MADGSPPRMFTLDEANALLPRLRDVLPALQGTKASLDRLQAELAALTQAASGNGHLLLAQMDRKRKEAESLSQQLTASLEEMQAIGCELKGIDEGLVDFPAEREGRTVYLCWKLGEERIDWWHELDTGFAGRQPM
jgi:hypothetical protein